MATRILIADDNSAVRQCIARLLSSHLNWVVCGEAANGEDAVQRALELIPDLIIMDFMMPNKNGIDAAREISQLLPGIPILLCSVFLTPQLVNLARLAGIAGALSKGDLNKVIPGIETILRGGTFFFSQNRSNGYEFAVAAPIP